MSQNTVIFMCGDFRLRDRDDELFMFYSRLDGAKPYRAILPGGCLPYQNEAILELAVLPYLHKGANHIHIEDHMGKSPRVPGCAAYANRHSQTYGSLVDYPIRVEEQDHFNQLEEAGKRFADFAARKNFGVTVNTGLYRHDESGFGSLSLLRVDRQIPLPTGGQAAVPQVLRH